MSDALAHLDAHLPPLPPSRRVAVLGGSFNPPHVAHALLAHLVLLAEDVEEVWVLPCADHPFGKDLAPFDDRLSLATLAFRHLLQVRVLDVENRLPAPSYTVNTLRALHAVRPGIEPAWVIGTDILAELDKWREPEAVKALCRFIVVRRAGYPGHSTLVFELPRVASTDVRAMLARGEAAVGTLDRQVLAAIRARGLYAAGPAQPPGA